MYLDGTEDPPEPKVPPKWCPQCRGELTTQWVATIVHSRRGYRPIASPRHVCATCKIAVRVLGLTARPLHTTRKAARAEGAKELRQRLKPLKR
jgi:hypothetical protein